MLGVGQCGSTQTKGCRSAITCRFHPLFSRLVSESRAQQYGHSKCAALAVVIGGGGGRLMPVPPKFELVEAINEATVGSGTILKVVA